jgi:hypothetical protein
MKTFAPAVALLLIMAIGTVARADPPELVDQVRSASFSRGDDHAVTVCARGVVMTGGYSHPTLTPARRVGHAGVYDLDFTAMRPEGIHTDMVSEIAARFVWRDAPADLKGVRVRGLKSSAIATPGAAGAC